MPKNLDTAHPYLVSAYVTRIFKQCADYRGNIFEIPNKNGKFTNYWVVEKDDYDPLLTFISRAIHEADKNSFVSFALRKLDRYDRLSLCGYNLQNNWINPDWIDPDKTPLSDLAGTANDLAQRSYAHFNPITIKEEHYHFLNNATQMSVALDIATTLFDEVRKGFFEKTHPDDSKQQTQEKELKVVATLLNDGPFTFHPSLLWSVAEEFFRLMTPKYPSSANSTVYTQMIKKMADRSPPSN